MIKRCEYCKKEFKTKKGHNNQRFCCKGCASSARYPEDIGLFECNYNNKITSYIVGLILTDGCITMHGKRKMIVISSKDKYILEMIRDIVCPQRKLYKDGNNFQVIWRNQKDVEILESMCITQRKTFTTKFIDYGDDVWHFIRGVFDGDGCVYISHIKDKKYGRDYYYKCVSIVTASASFARGIDDFFHENGINSHVSIDKRKTSLYVIQIHAKESIERFASLIYKDAGDWKLKRKYNIFYDIQE